MVGPRSLVPAAYADEVDADVTGRFELLEKPAQRARRELIEAHNANLSAARVLLEQCKRHRERTTAGIRPVDDERRALVVENERAVRMLVIRVLLKKLDFNVVHEATTYDAARELVQSERYDLVILDEQLDCGDRGSDVATLIREPGGSLMPLVPILLISGDDPDQDPRRKAGKLYNEELERAATWSGATSFLPKPFSPEELHSAVKELLRDTGPPARKRPPR